MQPLVIRVNVISHARGARAARSIRRAPSVRSSSSSSGNGFANFQSSWPRCHDYLSRVLSLSHIFSGYAHSRENFAFIRSYVSRRTSLSFSAPSLSFFSEDGRRGGGGEEDPPEFRIAFSDLFFPSLPLPAPGRRRFVVFSGEFRVSGELEPDSCCALLTVSVRARCAS